MEKFLNFVEDIHIHALIQQLRLKKAINLLEILIEYHPEVRRWYELRLICSSMKSNVRDFKVLYKIIQQKFPGSSLAWMAKALYPGVKIHLAKIALHTAEKLDAQNSYIYYFLAKTYLYMDNYPLALKYSDRCLEIDSNFHLSYLIRIECHRCMGNIPHMIRDMFYVSCLMQGINMKRLYDELLDELRRPNNSSNILPLHLDNST